MRCQHPNTRFLWLLKADWEPFALNAVFSSRIVFWALLLYSFWSFIYLTGNMPVYLFVFLSCSSCASNESCVCLLYGCITNANVQRVTAIVCDVFCFYFICVVATRFFLIFLFFAALLNFDYSTHTLITNCTSISLVGAVLFRNKQTAKKKTPTKCERLHRIEFVY